MFERSTDTTWMRPAWQRVSGQTASMWELQASQGQKRSAGSNVDYQHSDHISTPITFSPRPTSQLQHAIPPQQQMASQTNEARIILAIEAIRLSKKISMRRAAQLY